MVPGLVGAFAHPAGKAGVNKASFPDRLDHPAQGVMDDTIPKRGGADQPPLGFIVPAAVGWVEA